MSLTKEQRMGNAFGLPVLEQFERARLRKVIKSVPANFDEKLNINISEQKQRSWFLNFGLFYRPPESWSEFKKSGKLSRASLKNDHESHGKCKGGGIMHMPDKQKNELMENIKTIVLKGVTSPPKIIAELSKKSMIPVINGMPLSAESVYGYVRRVKKKEGVKEEPTLSMKVANLYKSGVTDKKEIMRLSGCGRDYVNKSLIRHGLINRQLTEKGRYS